MAERRTLETILKANGLVSDEQFKQIASYAHAVGIELYEAVLQKKIASPDAVMMAYAESIGLPFVHLADVSIDEEVAARIDPMTARQYSFIPVSIDSGYVLLATTKPVVPDVEAELRMRFDLPVRYTICTPAELSNAITKYYPRATARTSKTEPSKTPQQKQTVKPEKPVEPMSDEEKKDRLLKSCVAFNFSIALICFGLNYLQMPKGIYNTLYQFPFSALLGGVIGIVAAFVTWKKLSR
jgi:hypothetical protein